jgi:hypothetical protein
MASAMLKASAAGKVAVKTNLGGNKLAGMPVSVVSRRGRFTVVSWRLLRHTAATSR